MYRCIVKFLRIKDYWFRLQDYGWPGVQHPGTWRLDTTIAEFALPKIRQFKKLSEVPPFGRTQDEWAFVLNEIEWFLELHADARDPDPEEGPRYQKAKQFWGEHFQNLWW